MILFTTKKAIMESHGIGRKRVDSWESWGFVRKVYNHKGKKVGYIVFSEVANYSGPDGAIEKIKQMYSGVYDA